MRHFMFFSFFPFGIKFSESLHYTTLRSFTTIESYKLAFYFFHKCVFYT